MSTSATSRTEYNRAYYQANKELYKARALARKRRIAAEKRAEKQRMADAGLKVCVKCHAKKSVLAFYRSKDRKDGLYPYCKPCQRREVRLWVQRHKADTWERQRQRRDEAMALVAAAKAGRPCVDCGVAYPAPVMHFHHLDPSSKVATVSRLAQTGHASKVQVEIEKCVLLCSNCHILRHSKES